MVIGLVQNDYIRQEVLRFVDEHYFKRFGTHPSPPQIIFAALDGLKVVGTSALDFGDTINPIPIETIYKVRYKENMDNRLIAQYGRWISVLPGISQCLLYVASLYAAKKNKIYGLVEMKKVIVGVFTKLGIQLEELTDAELCLDKVRKGDMPYYIALPPPKLYLIKWEQVIGRLELKVRDMVMNENIKLV